MMTNKSCILKPTALAISLALLLAGAAFAGTAMKHGHAGDHGMAMHHQHIMLNHALGMAIEGSNLVMLGQMGMAKGIDEVSVEHGKMMMKNARNIWTEMIEGKSMKDMHDTGTPMTDPVMAYTHELAEAQLKVMDMLSKMTSDSHEDHGMAMHHQHIMLNHALDMALKGSNLAMIGQMGMAKGIDEVSVEHGNMMMKNARSLYNDIMSGEAMMAMHKKGASPEKDDAMAYTHELAGAQLKVMELLKKMPTD